MGKLSLDTMVYLLGYDLHKNKVDCMGVKHMYKTSHSSGSGGVNYFDNYDELVSWIKNTNEFRSSLLDGDSLLTAMMEWKSRGDEDVGN